MLQSAEIADWGVALSATTGSPRPRSGLPPCADQRPFPKAEPPLDEVTMMGNRSPDAKENSSNTEWPNRTPDAFMIRSGDE
jgi:hypothetical protein